MMARFREQHDGRRSFFRPGKKRPLKYIAILPALITLLNGMCGFVSIMFTSRAMESIAAGETGDHYFMLAAYMLLAAMVADVLDGRVARMSRTTSSFGGQLDSLCDVISFGVAPAFLAVKLMAHELMAVDVANPEMAGFLYRFVWLAGVLFAGCAAIRLARFNVENEEDESAHMSFRGLPSPAAAGVVMSLVILYVDLPKEKWFSPAAAEAGQKLIVLVLPAMVVALALLMVSRLRYPHVVNQAFRGKKRFTVLIQVLIIAALGVVCFEPMLAVVFVGFAASGPVRWGYHRFLARRMTHEEQMPTVTQGLEHDDSSRTE